MASLNLGSLHIDADAACDFLPAAEVLRQGADGWIGQRLNLNMDENTIAYNAIRAAPYKYGAALLPLKVIYTALYQRLTEHHSVKQNINRAVLC